jgi:hypothetical protein
MRAAIIGAGLLAALATGPASAFDQAAAQQVCGNDVDTLCSDAVPDQKLIAACMRRHLKEVSAPCRKFMADADAEMRRSKRDGRAGE